MERYGIIPKRFTKAWWEYFWDYYKWHTIITGVVISMVGIGAYQLANRVDYDFTLTLAGDVALPIEKEMALNDRLEAVIVDCDKNGENNALLQQLTLTSDSLDAQYAMAMSTKLTLEFTAGEGYLFIFDRDTLDRYLNSDSYELLAPVAEWAEVMPESDSLALAQGTPYAVKLADSSLSDELGLKIDDCYLLLRKQRKDEKTDEAGNLRYQSAKNAANLLLK